MLVRLNLNYSFCINYETSLIPKKVELECFLFYLFINGFWQDRYRLTNYVISWREAESVKSLLILYAWTTTVKSDFLWTSLLCSYLVGFTTCWLLELQFYHTEEAYTYVCVMKLGLAKMFVLLKSLHGIFHNSWKFNNGFFVMWGINEEFLCCSQMKCDWLLYVLYSVNVCILRKLVNLRELFLAAQKNLWCERCSRYSLWYKLWIYEKYRK